MTVSRAANRYQDRPTSITHQLPIVDREEQIEKQEERMSYLAQQRRASRTRRNFGENIINIIIENHPDLA